MEYNPATQQSGVFDNLVVTEDARVQLLEMAKWTKFLAIVNFIFLGLMVFAGIIAGLMLNSLGSERLGPLAAVGGLGVVLLYLVLAAVVFYPFYAMLRYSNGVRAALRSNNEGQFVIALRDLKRVFKYTGIITLIFLGLYALVFLGSGLLAAFR